MTWLSASTIAVTACENLWLRWVSNASLISPLKSRLRINMFQSCVDSFQSVLIYNFLSYLKGLNIVQMTQYDAKFPFSVRFVLSIFLIFFLLVPLFIVLYFPCLLYMIFKILCNLTPILDPVPTHVNERHSSWMDF